MKNFPEQNPTVFSPEGQDAIRKAILNRYLLAPYYYTLLWRAHAYGESVIRPMIYEYNSKTTFDTITRLDNQFMVGNSILVCAGTESKTIPCFLPKGKWCPITDDSSCVVGNDDYIEIEMTATSSLPAYFRQGSVVIGQWPLDKSGIHMQLVQIQKQNPYIIHATLDDNDYASGSVFIDDGVRFAISLIEIKGRLFVLIQ